MARLLRLIAAVVACSSILAGARDARADLGSDARDLEREWKNLGEARRLRPELLERGNLRPLLLPREFTDPLSEDCTAIAVLGPISTSFMLRFLPARGAPHWPEGEYPESSVAGAGQLVRCGARKAMLSRLVVEMRSPRAVLEFLVVRAPRPVPPLIGTLKHRDPGPVAPLGISGPRPLSAPLAERVRAIEQRGRREQARVERQRYQSGSDGSGQIPIELEIGCHRIDILRASPARAAPRPIDIDAELVWDQSLEIAAADRTESSDASLSFCIGERRSGRLRFVGALFSESVMVVESSWRLPAGIPLEWPAQSRARMAEAVREHHRGDLGSSPFFRALGVSGITLLPIEVEPGGCYLAAVAAIRGDTDGVALSAELATREAQNHSAPDGRGTAVAFCATRENKTTLTVEVRGASVAWLLAVWATGRVETGGVVE